VGLATGFALGMLRLLMQATHQSGGVDWGFLQWFVDINWLYFSFLLFAFTCAVIFAVSRFTPQAPPEQLAGLTYSTISRETVAEERHSYGFWEVFHTCVVAGIVIGIYIYFW
jgi:SSS family solute:Na+ symporter